MRYLLSLGVAMIAAQAAVAAPVTTFTTQNVQDIASAVGGKNITVEDLDGTKFVNFEYANLMFAASLRMCDRGTTNNCKGLLFAVAFEADATDTLETVNGFNFGLPMLVAVKPDSKTIAFGRFVTSIGGVESANVAANFGMLTAGPSIYATFKKSQVVASNGTGSAVLLSQANNAAPAMKPVKLSPDQLRGLMKLAPDQIKAP